MPYSIRNPYGWTLRKLIQNTYTHMYSRFEYKERDVLKSVVVRSVNVYDGANPGEARTKYIIRSSSYPQYAPYYTKTDTRGRPRKYQRTYKHEYDVTIQLDKLSIDDDRIKLRTGADAKWDFSSSAKGFWKGKGRSRRYVESKNVRRGINGDFFFRLEWLYYYNGILFGRNWTNGPPKNVNPKSIVFLDKHMLHTVEYLINRGVLQ